MLGDVTTASIESDFCSISLFDVHVRSTTIYECSVTFSGISGKFFQDFGKVLSEFLESSSETSGKVFRKFRELSAEQDFFTFPKCPELGEVFFSDFRDVLVPELQESYFGI